MTGKVILFAIGVNNTAAGTSALAMGNSSKALMNESIAIGILLKHNVHGLLLLVHVQRLPKFAHKLLAMKH